MASIAGLQGLESQLNDVYATAERRLALPICCARRTSASSLLGHEAVAQGSDPRNFNLDHVASLEVWRGAVSAHPDHIARPQREIFRQLDDERHDAEDHVVGLEAARLLAVDLNDGLHAIEIDVGLDPWAHRLEGVAILRTPQAAVGLLPGALGNVVADGVTEHAGHCVRSGQMFGLLADDDDELAFVMDLFGSGGRNHHVLIVTDQRVLRAITDLRPVRDVRYLAALVGGLLQVLEVIQPDAVEGAGDEWQLDLDVLQRMRFRRAPPLTEGIALDGCDLLALDDPPGCLARGGEFQPTHDDPSYSAAARGGVFQAPAAGRLRPRFSRSVLPA